MNRSIRHTFLAATTACGLWLAPATAQTTATTDPVGAMTMTILSGSDTAVGIPLLRPKVFEGPIVEKVSTDTLRFATDSFTSGEFTSKPHYIEIATGSGEGKHFFIISNTTDSVTVDLAGRDLSDVVSEVSSSNPDQVDIRPFWTPVTLFPEGLPAGSKIFLFGLNLGINKSASAILTTNGADWFQGLSNANDFAIHPTESFVCRLPIGVADQNLALTGSVPMVAQNEEFVTTVNGVTEETDFRISLKNPVGQTIGDTDLGFDPGDKVLVFDNSNAEVNKSASTILTFNGSDWFNGLSVANEFKLESGVGYVFRKRGSPTPANWVDTQQYLTQ